MILFKVNNNLINYKIVKISSLKCINNFNAIIINLKDIANRYNWNKMLNCKVILMK